MSFQIPKYMEAIQPPADLLVKVSGGSYSHTDAMVIEVVFPASRKPPLTKDPEQSSDRACMNMEIDHIGLNAHGCFAEYLRCHSRFTAQLPDELSFISAAPLACAGRTAWIFLLKAGLTTSQWGAGVALDARYGKETVVKDLHTKTNFNGVDATICLSLHPHASGMACVVTKMHNAIVQIGQPDIVEIPYREPIFRDIRIIGSCISGFEETQSITK
ncbi:hypothetical protein DM02DRAFT_652720 [Periconia macrospinosa]|uniref:Uncharacterized protein n=1 Tax=Periconia macrospinosa TaxID=97972 RepID=A0A2V1E281_9PLEO|nr:hypothetical protein DM02DRAFT_652720 [Periconia macrospinosa]